ncbi:unnamed protein product [Cuscuta campestris]|uniref:Uncharacterized protein n=1 Tax=Cuscuta campestris TaxID=132261 RepID=A0A484L1J4_9ASTE|nr:unnamed protein product [Cuscuta campestris]
MGPPLFNEKGDAPKFEYVVESSWNSHGNEGLSQIIDGLVQLSMRIKGTIFAPQNYTPCKVGFGGPIIHLEFHKVLEDWDTGPDLARRLLHRSCSV